MNNNFIAVKTLCNFGGIGILETNSDFVTSAFSYDSEGDFIQPTNKKTTRIFYDKEGRAFFKRYNVKYYIDEFIRV